MIKATLHIQEHDGSTTGMQVEWETLPRIGDDVTLIDAEGTSATWRVTRVNHLVGINDEMTSTFHTVEVTCTWKIR